MDCHLPAPHDTFDFFFAKTAHGLKDVVLHFVGEPYDRAAMRRQAWRNIENAQCQKCHRNILYMPQKRGAMLAHRTVLYPRPGYEQQCTDCHRFLVHKPKRLYQYAGAGADNT
jgi:nitrate/TMAO reductase-like tetraheme cytochrome c subunit